MPSSSATVTDAPSGVVAPDPEQLVAAILDEEERRHGEQDERSATEQAIPVDKLAGVGGESMPMREVVRRGGLLTFGVLCGLPFVDSLQNAVFGVLAPEIQKSLRLSLTEVGIIGALGGVTVLLTAVPFGRLGDRYRRFPIVAGATLGVAACTFLAGFAHTAWQMVLCIALAGLGKGNEGPVQASLAADAFPIEGRNRVFGMIRAGQGLGWLVGPALVGLIASLAPGSEPWRWAFFILALPLFLLGLLSFFTPEPRRGRQEMMAVLGEELEDKTEQLPIPLRVGFARLKKVRSFNFFIIGVSVLGFNMIAAGIFAGIFVEQKFGLGAGERGLLGSLGSVGTLIGIAVGAPVGDRLFRKSPERSVRFTATLIAVSGLFASASYLMPNPWLYAGLQAVAHGCTFAGFATMQAAVAAAMPYRLRGTGMAMVSVYLSMVGGVGGAIAVGLLQQQFSLQVALATIALVGTLGSGAALTYGSRFVEGDMALASADLLEEQAELQRVAAGAATPVLQIRNLDFSYGAVQVLFGVNLDVWEGEVLALLGTNGAGKSTVLRAVTGLGQPDRGVIRLDGRTITFAEPGTRLAHGIVEVPGGKATFPNLTVAESLRLRGWSVRRGDLDERIERVLEVFPRLRERLDQRAGTLSGGEQQMLAIAGALILDPKLLVIDELSLGLAPVMVQELLEVVTRLKEQGLTMIIVEQSLNVALSIADRAVFMEKGQVRFEGPALELLERDDIVRAVFLGGEGG